MRRSSLPLSALVPFRAAARLHSFSRAADALSLTHGAVSRAVRLLEDHLGTMLFERQGRGVMLTEAGRDLAQAVEEGLGRIETVAEAMRERQAGVALTVSCEPTLLMRWLIPRLPAFQSAHPGLDLRLMAGGGPVQPGPGLDLAIRRDDFALPPGWIAEPLFAERIGPVCRPDLVAQFFDGADLRPEAPRLHSRTRPSAWEDWRELAGSQGHGPAQVFDHFYFSLQAAVAGLGVAIGPWHLVRDDLEAGLLAAPAGFRADGSRYLLLTARALLPGGPAAQFRDWLRAA